MVNGAVQLVEAGRIRRLPVSLGVRGSRAVEVIGNVGPGALVATPARMDLRDGSRVLADTPTKIPLDPPVGAARTRPPIGCPPTAGATGHLDRRHFRR